MTNLEALKAVVGVEGISDNSYSKALIDSGIDGTGTYSASNESVVNISAINVLENFLLTSLSEGGYSVSYDRSAIEKKISVLKGTGVRGVQRLNI